MEKSSFQACEVAQFALPDHHYVPPRLVQGFDISSISRAIGSGLFVPERCVGLRAATETAIVAMPKTAVDENKFSLSRENDVGFSGEIGDMEAITIACVVKKTTHDKFRLRVFAADPAHQTTSLSGGETIHRSVTARIGV